MPNRLADETSPYLRQHSDNPVDWQPWGPAALAEARERDVPLIVSIGYSSCHWCHVMAHESFEDPDVAAYMNAHFVPVKVDREERPDVDAIYMEAAQAMTGHGGWPLNAFVTPEQIPFYAGTYFPPHGRQGMPSWLQVLEAVSEAWRDRRPEIREQGERIRAQLGAVARLEPDPGEPEPGLIETAAAAIVETADPRFGGFGSAPKFPQASAIELLLSRAGRPSAVALDALWAMARGGIYDQLGGGFARYSVDATWTVPHFEKMLYDNALLARAYLHGWQVSGEDALLGVATDTLDWALREMRGPEGGFASALDADSDGVEGKFYVWSLDELRGALADDGLYGIAVDWYGASADGNFEGVNVLTAPRLGIDPKPAELPEIERRLFLARDQRVRPGLDDKRLTSWNALMVSALADAGAALERVDYLDAAAAAADFVLRELRDPDGRLLRTYNDGRAQLPAYLEDHAYMVEALVTLYEATFETRWFIAARELADVTIARFFDRERGGFFSTADDHEALVTRRKDLEDTPIPSGNSAAAFGLLRLARLSGSEVYESAGRSVIALLHPVAARHPNAFAHLLRAIDFATAGDVREVAVVGSDGAGELLRVVRSAFRPHVVLAGTPEAAAAARGTPGGEEPAAGDGEPVVELLRDRHPIDGRAAAYVCEHFTCQAPVTDPGALARQLA